MLLKENIPIKYVFGKIKKEVFFVFIYAVVVAIVYDNFHITRISIPIAVPTILGTIISLLLAFKSNQAYDRWWEARILWGAIVNDSRTLSRQILTLVDSPYTTGEVAKFKTRFIKRQIAWCYALSKSLRGMNVNDELGKYIHPDELEYIKKYTNKSSAILELHGMDLNLALKQGWVNEYQQIAIDNILTRLCDSMGGCERIKNTVFPVTYSLYIHFTVNLFIILLPFGLIEFFGWMEIPLVMAIASAFLLIEKMAIHLQDPFENKPTDTPTTAISKTIERDLLQMLKDNIQEEKTTVHASKKLFYIL